jgi:hypothetical protein
MPRYLNDNQLTGSIPESIGNLPQLYQLYGFSTNLKPQRGTQWHNAILTPITIGDGGLADI